MVYLVSFEPAIIVDLNYGRISKNFDSGILLDVACSPLSKICYNVYDIIESSKLIWFFFAFFIVFIAFKSEFSFLITCKKQLLKLRFFELDIFFSTKSGIRVLGLKDSQKGFETMVPLIAPKSWLNF